MANKPASRNWNDIQVAIAATSMVLTLTFWNLFAAPDRELALKRAQEQAAQDQAAREQAQAQALAAQVQVAPGIIAQPAPTQMSGPILLGGSAPQTQVIQSGGRRGGGGGGTGGS